MPLHDSASAWSNQYPHLSQAQAVYRRQAGRLADKQSVKQKTVTPASHPLWSALGQPWHRRSKLTLKSWCEATWHICKYSIYSISAPIPTRCLFFFSHQRCQKRSRSHVLHTAVSLLLITRSFLWSPPWVIHSIPSFMVTLNAYLRAIPLAG